MILNPHLRISAVVCGVAALVACAPPASQPAPAAGSSPAAILMAVGQEPGWTLEITPQPDPGTVRLAYAGDYGTVVIDEPAVAAASPGGSAGYRGVRLAVTVTPGQCADSVSGELYTQSVAVMADGRSYRGCGGAKLPGPALVGTDWQIVKLGSRAVADPAATAMTFDGTRMSGSAGCNRLGASYSLIGQPAFGGGGVPADDALPTRIIFGPVMATKMACPGPADAQEAALIRLLDGELSLRRLPGGTILMRNKAGDSAELAAGQRG